MKNLFTITILAFFWAATTLPAQNASDLRLVPFPKEVELEGEQRFSLKEPIQLFISTKEKDILGTAISDELKRAGFPAPTIHEGTISSDYPLIVLGVGQFNLTTPELPKQVGEEKSNIAESYALSVYPQGIVCVGKDATGLYYAVQTLRQLIRANTDEDGTLPCLTIRDWPSMKYRCFQDDWTRGPSPHLETLFYQFDLGSELKHNMFTYYMEDQFEFKKHPKINPKDGTLTQEEFKKSVEYAASRHLTVLGNQQSFGHHYKMLAIPEYAHLGEAGYILSPAVEEVYTFLDEIYSEIIPLVPFEMFNVCCDETWDLAKSGPSKEMADEIGVGGVYVKHILRVYDLLKKYNKRMLMWGDIIIDHPDKLELIPKDVVMMCWDYAPRDDFDAFITPFSDSGYEFFVCPGQSNWSVILPLINAYMVNIQNFVRDGCKHGAIGMLNTGWEDDGEAIHGYNWHAIAWGAECSWNAAKTDRADFNKRIGAVLFGAKGDDFGKAIELLAELQVSPELGNSYNWRFWDRDFLPRAPRSVVEKNANRILELVRPAIAHLRTTKEQATVNEHLLDSFILGAQRLELIGTRMLAGLEVTKVYTDASLLDLSDPVQKELAPVHLKAAEIVVAAIRLQHRALEKEFVRIWNSESKPFSLDRVTQKYDDLDQWLLEIENRIKDVREKVMSGQINTVLPDIGLNDAVAARKTRPTNVVSTPMSLNDGLWLSEASVRMGVTVEAGNVDRFNLPIELEISVPEAVREKNVIALRFSPDETGVLPIWAQLDPIPGKPTQLLTFIISELKKEETAKICVYFGLDPEKALPPIKTFEGEDGMIVIDNVRAQIHLGSEGGHAYRWFVLGDGGRRWDITDPGDSSYHGFCDHGHADRSRKFDLVCLNNGPVMVRYGCFYNGDLYKTLTVYAGMPVIEVALSMPTGYYWDFDNPENFAANGPTPGTFLFSNGVTGPTPIAGTSVDLQTREPQTTWAAKFNDRGLALGLTTPGQSSTFVIGPGGGMGGVGIEHSESRSHFVTYAGMLSGQSVDSIMEALHRTLDLKNQPTVTLYEKEEK